MARLLDSEIRDILHDALRMFDENGEQFLEDHGMKIERITTFQSPLLLMQSCSGLELLLSNGQRAFLTVHVKND